MFIEKWAALAESRLAFPFLAASVSCIHRVGSAGCARSFMIGMRLLR
jgi:hypothetical protein